MQSMTYTANGVYNQAKRTLSTAPPNDAYLKWDVPGVEETKPGEDTKTARIADAMNLMQSRNFAKHRRCFRATHVKTQGIVKGTLTVPSDLPPHLSQGLFTTPGEYDVAARYANEPVFLQPDTEPGPRGMAVRIFGVKGERLAIDGNEHNSNQDFFFNNAPMIELTDLDTCLEIMQMRERNFDSPTGLSLAMKTRSDALKQHAPGMLPNTNVVSHAMFTQSAFRFGDYYAHMALFPVLDSMKAKTEKVQLASSISDWLFDYFQGAPAKYEFKIQLGTSPEHHPTEDASVVWDEATAPYQTVGTLEFPPQDSFLHARRVFWEDHLALNPWMCLVAHQPLGGINRLRKTVYERSQKKRDEINASHSKNVQNITEVP